VQTGTKLQYSTGQRSTPLQVNLSSGSAASIRLSVENAQPLHVVWYAVSGKDIGSCALL
jgi:hypothetical protein